MQIKPILAILLCWTYLGVFGQAGDDERQRYVDQFSWLAVQEMERTGVPASIKLGQAILESRWGTSVLARKANNHFGIKCGGSWSGGTFYREDDDYVLGELIPSCFRAYSNTQASYVAHSNFLIRNSRYASLFALKQNDYKGWAKGLKKAGYATAKHYHRSLIKVIEDLQLYKYDKMKSADFGLLTNTTPSNDNGGIPTLPPNGPAKAPKPENISRVEILVNNDVKYVVSQKGETLESLAKKLDIPVKWLLSYNENIDEATESLPGGEWVYLQAKRKNYRGRQKWHDVTQFDNMFTLSQRYGVNLSQLYQRNHMIPGTEPKSGTRIKLRGGKVKTAPALRPIRGAGQQWRTVPNYKPAKAKEKPQIKKEKAATSGKAAQIILETENNKVQKPEEDRVSSGSLYHRVAIGDTLETIATQYRLKVDQLREWNHLPEKATLMVGMRLRVQ